MVRYLQWQHNTAGTPRPQSSQTVNGSLKKLAILIQVFRHVFAPRWSTSMIKEEGTSNVVLLHLSSISSRTTCGEPRNLPSSSVVDFQPRLTRATVEDSTAGLGQTLRVGRPLVHGLTFRGTSVCGHGFTGTHAAKGNSSPSQEKRGAGQNLVSWQTDEHWERVLFVPCASNGDA